ncbi:MAG: hypothetical protein HGA45_16695 [Chloroflexales bacterium]|nr:hypothetical protein [Chloroflexales bacterium]
MPTHRRFRGVLGLAVIVLLLTALAALPPAQVRGQSGQPQPLPHSDQPAVSDPGAQMQPDLPGYTPPASLDTVTLADNLPAEDGPALAATCTPALQNPTLDYGLGWSVVEPLIATDNRFFTSAPNSFRMTDGDDLSRFPFADTGDAFGQGFFVPADTAAALVEFKLGYFGANFFDRVYYAFHLLDAYGQPIYPAVGVGVVPLTVDGVWQQTADLVVNPSILGPMRGRPAALIVSFVSDAFIPASSVWIDDVQVTLCGAGARVPSPPSSGPGPSALDTGFRPRPDGYSFENYGGVNLSDYTLSDMRWALGDAVVCLRTSRGCVPRPQIVALNQQLNEQMDGGHCYGMAVTSQRFFNGQDAPGTFQPGAGSTFGLRQAFARRNIAYFFVQQFYEPLSTEINVRQASSTAVNTLNRIRTILSQTPDELPVIGIFQPGAGGHAITAYAVEDRGGGIWRVWVYDNIHPADATRYIEVNVSTNTWRYDLGGSLGVWGGSQPGTFVAIPLSLHSGPFALPQGLLSSTSLAASEPVQIWQSGNYDLLITDQAGRRIGQLNGSEINEIPDAFIQRPIGGLGVEGPPIYRLPTASTSIQIDGSGLSQPELAEVTQFGPGYAVSVQSLSLTPGTSDQLTIAPDGSEATLTTAADRTLNLSLMRDGDTTGQSFLLRGLDLSASGSLSARVTTDTLTIDQTSGGTYSLDLTQYDQGGAQRFIANDLTLGPDDIHYIDYAGWEQTDALTLRIDQGGDGSIDQTVTITNQIAQAYLPIVNIAPSANLAGDEAP